MPGTCGSHESGETGSVRQVGAAKAVGSPARQWGGRVRGIRSDSRIRLQAPTKAATGAFIEPVSMTIFRREVDKVVPPLPFAFRMFAWAATKPGRAFEIASDVFSMTDSQPVNCLVKGYR